MSEITAGDAASAVIVNPAAERPQNGWQIDAERADALQVYFDASLGFQSWRVRFLNWVRRLYGAAALVFIVICVAQTATIAHLVPAQRLVPVILVMQPDGTIDSESRIQDLPPNKEVAAVRAALWLYVKDRESFTWDDAPGRYAFVNAVSSRTVRQEYDDWMAPGNPASPQRLMRDGHIGVEMISLVFTSPTIAVVRYRRTLEKKGDPIQTTTWTAALDFVLTSRLPEVARVNGDPGGVVVTNYQSSQDTAGP